MIGFGAVALLAPIGVLALGWVMVTFEKRSLAKRRAARALERQKMSSSTTVMALTGHPFVHSSSVTPYSVAEVPFGFAPPSAMPQGLTAQH